MERPEKKRRIELDLTGEDEDSCSDTEVLGSDDTDDDDNEVDHRVEDMVVAAPPPVEGKVDYHWKAFFLTYAQAEGLTKETIFDWFHANEGSINKLLVGSERHADGGKHFHVYIQFTERKRLRNIRKWDIGGYHPNIQKVRSEKKCKDYCIKDGDYVGDFNHSRYNYRKEVADTEAWQSDRRFELRPDVQFPIRLPGGHVQHEPEARDKQISWWLKGPPNSGKTYWSQRYFGSSKVYDVPTEERYRYEAYRGEKVIIFDDVVPTREEIIRLSNYWYRETEVPYSARYTRKYLPVKTRIILIILSNDWPDYMDDPAIVARFNFITVTEMDFSLNEPE